MNGTLNPFHLWPVAASSQAAEIDRMVIAFTVVLVFLAGPVFILNAYWAWHYRHGRAVDRSYREARNLKIELSWMLIPFAFALVFFAWSGTVYDTEFHAPPDAMVIQAVGRQWMWKFQHPGGQWEINDLHVPVGSNVRINIQAQDVVHALYIPALRVQMDAIPGRPTMLWFRADRVGAYHLFCSELCGVDHSVMDGVLYVMTPAAFQAWLRHATTSGTLAAAGKKLFTSYGCSGCHTGGSSVRAPSLEGVYGRPVPLQNGQVMTADDAYLRDSILFPKKHIVAGYKSQMPSYNHKIPESDLVQLIEYIKSLATSGNNAP